MSKMIQCPSELIEGKRKDSIFVFLAGPIQGAPDWQSDKIIDFGKDVTLINPRRKEYPDPNFVWEYQVDWETKALRCSDIVLMWIPKEKEHVEGRDYAQTTKIELMENIARGKTLVFGADPSIHGLKYLQHKYESYTGRKMCGSLEEVIKEVKEIIAKKTEKVHYFYTSDTHFGSQRSLELSKRPFRTVDEMDWTMIERWNNVVGPHDVVYHLGDFGNADKAKYLNGNINFLYGNYERPGGFKWSEELTKYNIKCFSPVQFTVEPEHRHDLILSHEPLSGKPYIEKSKMIGDGKFLLFGHIHGRARMKKWGDFNGAIDVGVDANNYTPMSEEDVDFYINAIRKYYDKEVWC